MRTDNGQSNIFHNRLQGTNNNVQFNTLYNRLQETNNI